MGDTLSGGRGNDLLDLGEDLRHPKVTHVGHETLTYADSATGAHVDLAQGVATGEGRDRIAMPKLIDNQQVYLIGSMHHDVLLRDGPPGLHQPAPR